MIVIIIVDINRVESFGGFHFGCYVLPSNNSFIKIAGIAPVGGSVAVIDGYLQFIIPAAGVCSYLFRPTRQGKAGCCIPGNVNSSNLERVRPHRRGENAEFEHNSVASS